MTTEMNEQEIPTTPEIFLTSILNQSGQGSHLLTIARVDANGEPSVCQFSFEYENDTVIFNQSELMETVSDMAMGLVEVDDAQIGATLRSFNETGSEVRCWAVFSNEIYAADSQTAIEAHCIDANTGKILEPEPNVIYCDAWDIAVN